MKKNKKSPS